MRTLISSGFSGLVVKSWPPHSTQKDLIQPPSLGSQENAALLNGLDSAAFLSSTITVRKSPIGEVANNAISGELAQCNLGERAISGGSTWTTTPGANTMVTLESAPVSGLTGWTVTMGNTSGSLQKFQVVAICVAG